MVRLLIGLVVLCTSAPLVQVALLMRASPGAGDQLGGSLSADGDVIVAGAEGADGGRGAAFVFERGSTGWASANEVARLVASDREIGSGLGSAVGICGDTVVVGAERATVGTRSAGAAYVFERPGGGWQDATEVAKLTHVPNVRYIGFESFGAAAAVSGDTVVVGAPGVDEVGVLDQGAAYVFVRPDGGWQDMTQTAVLVPSDGATSDLFGTAVAIEGDTIVVGALKIDPPLYLGVSAAYVFEKPAGGWQGEIHEIAKLEASDPQGGNYFGSAVAIHQDTIAVGAVGIRKVYVFDKPPAGWVSSVETAQLTLSLGGGSQRIGYHVAVDDNAIVATTDSGGPCVYRKPAGGWASASQDERLIGRVATLAPGGVVTALPGKMLNGAAQAGQVLVYEYVFDPPVLGGVSTSPVPNYSPSQIDVTVTGQGLQTATGVTAAGQSQPIVSKSPTSLTFSLPNGFPIGVHDVEVSNPVGSSNATTFAVEGVHPSVLLAPTTHPGGQVRSYTTYTDAGWNVVYLLSMVNGTTALPGIVSFAIGGGALGNLVPVVTLAADGGGFADAPITMPPGVPGPLTLYWQCMTFDPGVPLGLQAPIETSNATSVLTVF